MMIQPKRTDMYLIILDLPRLPTRVQRYVLWSSGVVLLQSYTHVLFDGSSESWTLGRIQVTSGKRQNKQVSKIFA